MKQTAVELLAQLLGLMSSNPLVKQAKELEKQQIIDAYDEGYTDAGYADHRANHYYNETFPK
jgi:hypothetical protein